MVGHGQVILNLIELGAHNVGGGVLLRVHDTGLDAAVGIAHAQRRGVAAQGSQQVAHQLGVTHTHLHALQIIGGVDFLIGGHDAEAVGGPAQDLQALLLGDLLQLLGSLALGELLDLIPAAEDIGHAQHIEHAVIVGQVGIGVDDHVLGAALDALQHLGAGAQLLSGENVDLDRAAALLLNDLLEGFGHYLIMMLGVVGVAQAQGDLGAGRGAVTGGGGRAAAGGQRQDHRCREDQRDNAEIFHVIPSFQIGGLLA